MQHYLESDHLNSVLTVEVDIEAITTNKIQILQVKILQHKDLNDFV